MFNLGNKLSDKRDPGYISLPILIEIVSAVMAWTNQNLNFVFILFIPMTGLFQEDQIGR